MSQAPSALSERQIRSALLAQLQSGAGQDELLIEELGVGTARVDLAQVAAYLCAFEIKSDFDTLDRLARQMHAYHCVFDRLTIVTTESFVAQVAALLPPWWGIWLAMEAAHGTVNLSEIRAAQRHDRQDTASLAALLWRDEAYAFVMETLGRVVRSRATRGELQEVIAAEIPLAAVRARVMRVLRSREVLRARSHVTGQQLTHCENDMVAGRISTPSHEAA